jgi:hypothetical protein
VDADDDEYGSKPRDRNLSARSKAPAQIETSNPLLSWCAGDADIGASLSADAKSDPNANVNMFRSSLMACLSHFDERTMFHAISLLLLIVRNPSVDRERLQEFDLCPQVHSTKLLLMSDLMNASDFLPLTTKSEEARAPGVSALSSIEDSLDEMEEDPHFAAPTQGGDGHAAGHASSDVVFGHTLNSTEEVCWTSLFF